MIVIKGKEEHSLFFVKVDRNRCEISPVSPYYFIGKYPKNIIRLSKKIIKHHYKNRNKRISWYVFGSEKEATEFFNRTNTLFYKYKYGQDSCTPLFPVITAKELETGILNVTP